MKDRLFMQLLENQFQSLEKVMACNSFTSNFGLTLTKADVLVLLEERKVCLKDQERIEFGQGILDKLVFAFCDSSYIYQDNYTETVGRLQSIFYLYKNESLDQWTDDELIEFMATAFNGVCQGSLDYLEDTCLESFAREVRRGGEFREQ